MRASGNFCHCGARLTLRSRADDDDIFAWQQRDITFGNKIWQIAQIPDFLRSRHRPLDRTANHRNGPVIGLCRLDDRLNTGNIA